MSLRLSIIIPFYNVEQYIAECLDSVYNQDISEEEYEVICVNDASPDHSRDIVLEYQKRHSNLVLVEHEVNKKLGSARNTGRTVANGKYIWNVDSDDKIVPNCLGQMLSICEANELDVLEFSTKKICESCDTNMPHPPLTKTVIRGIDYLNSISKHEVSLMCPVWNKMIKRAFLDSNNIFSPEINMGEDIPYSFLTILHAERLLVIESYAYLYRVIMSSLTGQSKVPSAAMLYEECLINSKQIFDVSKKIPAQYKYAKESFFSTAQYTFLKFETVWNNMPMEQQDIYRKRCRGNFFRNFYLVSLLTKKQYFKYLMWLFGKALFS